MVKRYTNPNAASPPSTAPEPTTEPVLANQTLTGWALHVAGIPLARGTGQPPALWSWMGSGPRALPDGAYPATDALSNTSTATATLTVSDGPPEAALTAVPRGLFLQLDWSADEDARTCTVRVQVTDGGWQTVATTCAGSLLYPGTDGARYTVRFTATDRIGNVTEHDVDPLRLTSVTRYYLLGTGRGAMRQGDLVYYLYGDHLGSILLVTDEEGETVHTDRYRPYGEAR